MTEFNSASKIRLPMPISSFIGRESELARVHQILAAGARLVTLVGPGGVGKTRLALEACAREASRYPDGVAFVTLEAVSEAEFVLPEIARGLSVELSGTASPLEDLISALKGKRQLLCVDNWEHLIEAAVQIVPLIVACPDLQVISTSREALRLRGEQVIWVEPLLLPSLISSFKPESVSKAQAVQLFVERARAARPGFELEEGNTAAVVEICSLVDGLPLAVELAAVLLRLYSPEALLARMKKSGKFADRPGSIDLLVGGPRDLPTRQQTLRSTIDWSYSLLDPEEQSVFQRISVFTGGCDLEAAVAVCGVDIANERPLLDILIALVDKSLVRVQEIDDGPRFSMLRTIQEFALEKLQLFDELSVSRERHAIFCRDLAARLNAKMRGSDRAAAIEQLVREYDNCRAALNWAIDQHDIDVSMELCRNLTSVWLYSGLLAEGRRWVKRTLVLQGSVDPQLKAAVLYKAASMALHQGQNASAHEYLTESIALARECEDTKGVATALIYLGTVEIFQREDLETILNHINEGVELSRSIDSPDITAFGLIKAGWALLDYRHYKSAREYAQQAIEIWSSFPEAPLLSLIEGWDLLGEVNTALGNYEQAEEYLLKAMSASQQLYWRVDLLSLYCDLGKLAIRRNQLRDAEHYLSEILKSVKDVQSSVPIIDALDVVACLAQAQSSFEVAAQLWGACEIARVKLDLPRTPHEQAYLESYIHSAQTKLGKVKFKVAFMQGETMSLEQAVQLALQPIAAGTGKQVTKIERKARPAGLSAREVEVLRLVAQGLSDIEVAEILVLSPRTVNAHLTSIYSKLGVNSRVAATRFAVDNGLAA